MIPHLSIELDKRALAIWRICMGLLLVIDLWIRWDDIPAFYGEEGLVPVAFYQYYCSAFQHFTIHSFLNNLTSVYLIFIVHGIAAICFMAGFGTRLAAFICWFLLASLNTRNPMILQGGDDLLRMGFFWALFLPVDDCYRLGKQPSTAHTYRYKGIAATALMIQVACVYFFSALQKSSPEWHSEGTALYYALSLDQLALAPGKWIYPYPALLKTITHVVYFIELLAPILLFISYQQHRFRILGIALLILFHIGAGSTLYVGLFSAIGITMLIALTPIFAFKDNAANGISSEAINEKKWLSWFAIVITGYVLAWNLGNAPVFPYKMKALLMKPGHWLRLDQNWGVFAPRVYKEDGWIILAGTKTDGSLIDVYRNGKPMTEEKPLRIVSEIKNDRWRKLEELMVSNQHAWLRNRYCSFKLREWNKNHPNEQLKKLDLIFMLEMSLPDYQIPKPEKKFWCTCYE